MLDNETLDITSKWKHYKLDVSKILYVLMDRKNAEIHIYGGDVYVTRITCEELKKKIGENFVEIRRGCIVSAMAISGLTDTVDLINGESLKYTPRRKKEIRSVMYKKQQDIINSFAEDSTPSSREEYRQHYICYENAPFAFADIEMVFDGGKQAVDWIFRYGNEKLAELEGVALDRLIDSKFGSIFDNMDTKWVKYYEKAALYGEMLEINDYSPEIDRDLKVICFPTFKGHCGCILFYPDSIIVR